MTAILTGVRWNLHVALIYISSMASVVTWLLRDNVLSLRALCLSICWYLLGSKCVTIGTVLIENKALTSQTWFLLWIWQISKWVSTFIIIVTPTVSHGYYYNYLLDKENWGTKILNNFLKILRPKVTSACWRSRCFLISFPPTPMQWTPTHRDILPRERQSSAKNLFIGWIGKDLSQTR